MSNTNRSEWIVTADESGIKLQSFLKDKINITLSAKQIKQAIDSGNCQLNGRVERFASKIVGRGDKIIFYLIEQKNAKSLKPSLISLDHPSRRLYLDEHLVIYDKPAGWSSESPDLFTAVQTYCPSIQLVHRLDRDTTGVLIFARNKKTVNAMLSLFKERKVKKTYLALVDGVMKKSRGVVNNFLGRLSSYQGQSLWGEVAQEKGGLSASTMWQVKKLGKDASLVVCHPKTGRTHQIRVHLSGLGHPILGDFQYGKSFRCNYRAERVMLHAYEIEFEHPISKEKIHIVAKPPKDFVEAEAALV